MSEADATAGAAGGDGFDARWAFEPGRGIEPGSATAVNGQAARFTFSIDRWGKRKLGTAALTLHDRWRLAEGRVALPLPAIDCYPAPAIQRTEVVLSKLPNRLGEHRARVPGDGTEFTGVREFVPGDRQRAINWPASTRLGRLQVNTFAAERSQDVVLLVDATSDVGEPGQSALDLGLRGASGAARAYLAARDRVGVITYQWGGAHWLAPSLGRRQFYRIVDALLQSDTGFTRAGVVQPPAAGRAPAGRARGRVLAADRRPVRRDPAGHARARLLADRGGRAQRRAAPPPRLRRQRRPPDLALEQQAIRFSLRELGVPVVAWDGVAPLDLPLAPYTRRPLVTRR